MKKYLVFLAAALLQAGAWAVTYTYTGPTYNAADITNFSSCPGGAGDCGAYTHAMAQGGSLTTIAPLSGNLNGADISALVTSFSFFDGLTTFASNDPQVTLIGVEATTTGGVLQIIFNVQRWQTPAPHLQGDHFDGMVTMNSGSIHNFVCTGGPQQNPQGQTRCQAGAGIDGYASWVNPAPGGTWAVTGLPPVASTAVPTLGEWGLLLLASLMLGASWMAVGRRRI